MKQKIDSSRTTTGRRLALGVVLLAFFMDLLDSTIVNIAIPSIRDHLGSSYADVQWIIAGYSLAFASLLIIGGRLGDAFGYRRIFLWGMAGFTIASAIAGLAPSTEILIAARVLQGAMAAMMVPQTLSIIQVLFAPAERTGISIFYGALGGLASVAGPIVGAVLLKLSVIDDPWRLIFLVNVPVGIVAIIAASRVLPYAKSSERMRFDGLGVVLLIGGLLALLFPIIQGRALGWPLWGYGLMALSAIILTVFAIYEHGRTVRHASPLVATNLFQNRSFSVSVLMYILSFAVIIGFFLILTLFLQIGLGFDALHAGLTSIPFALGVGVSAGISGQVLLPKIGSNVISLGALMMSVGFGLLAWLLHTKGMSIDSWSMVAPLIVAGLGMGAIVAPITPLALYDVPLKDAGSASGVINAAGQTGAAIGIAVVGALFLGYVTNGVTSATAHVEQSLKSSLPAFMTDADKEVAYQRFRTCFRDRTNEEDTKRVPASCLPEAGQADTAIGQEIGTLMASKAQEALRFNFIHAFIQSLKWEAAGMFIVFCVSLIMPRRRLNKDRLQNTVE